MQTSQAPAPAPAKPKPAPPPPPPPEYQEGAIASMGVADLVKILSDAASPEFQKAKACVRAGELGDKAAVPALAALLASEHLSTYARYGLEPIEDASAADALRAGLTRLKGTLLIGVVNSLGKRRDQKALPTLTRMMYGADVELARAAASAIGSIGGPVAVKELQTAVPKSAGMVKAAVADACLVCAERLLEAGERDQALKLYAFVSAADVPKAARLAAMNSIVREETSVNRPR